MKEGGGIKVGEIRFKRDTALRKQFFVPDSFAHPAKMDAQLLIWMVERYTKVGETILDPMAGSGTTMLACMLGRNVILVELEEKFIKMCEANWERVKMRPQLGYEMGGCQIIQGDARNLSNILCDSVIFSLPYAIPKTTKGSLDAQEGRVYQDTRQGRAGTKWEFSGQEELGHPSPNNIANLPYGQIDAVVTSPPFQEADIQRPGKEQSVKDYQYGTKQKHQGQSPDNIANLAERSYGNIDSIITSPPYERGLDACGAKSAEGAISIGDIKAVCKELGIKHASENMPAFRKKMIERKRQYVDSIITSPPYEHQLHDSLDERLPTDIAFKKARLPVGFGGGKDNIGNLKSDTYLEAMFQVYQQCYKVLKPQGLMILVVKNFIRNKKEVDLKGDTIKLCEQAGFQFFEEHHRILPSQSFWRVIYKQKFPDAPEIDREYVLVFKR